MLMLSPVNRFLPMWVLLLAKTNVSSIKVWHLIMQSALGQKGVCVCVYVVCVCITQSVDGMVDLDLCTVATTLVIPTY